MRGINKERNSIGNCSGFYRFQHRRLQVRVRVCLGFRIKGIRVLEFGVQGTLRTMALVPWKEELSKIRELPFF